MSAPVIHHFQNRCLRRFHDAGATDATSARPLAEIGISDSMVFRYLRFRGIVCEAEPGEYYVDAQAEKNFRRKRLQFSLAVVSCVAVVIAAMLILSVLRR